MPVERIKRLQIDARGLFTGVFGKLDDYYIDNDLRRYTLIQELYLYLTEEGYLTVFYTRDQNFFTFKEKDLAELFSLKHSAESKTPKRTSFLSQIKSPFTSGVSRGLRIKTDNEESNTPPSQLGTAENQYPGIGKAETKGLGTFYFLRKRERVLDFIFSYSDKYPDKKVALVFPSSKTEEFSNDKDILTKFLVRKQDSLLSESHLRILAFYDSESVVNLRNDFDHERGFFYDRVFKNILFSNENQTSILDEDLFLVGEPRLDEVRNCLNRKRLVDCVDNLLSPIPFEKLSHILWQRDTVDTDKGSLPIQFISELDSMDSETLSKVISGLDTDSFRDRLYALSGIDEIRKQFERYVNFYKVSKQRKAKKSDFRPHMLFLGPPGTGKTTVAKLFAGVLADEGLLERGHLITATVGDLVGQYVGETRIKTAAICEKALGGILFIDEAYGLHNPSSEHNYEKEAQEVLIQYMENHSDLVVIFAGYKGKIMELLDKGNEGFKSRFNLDLASFEFLEYSPDELYEIAMRNLRDYEVTEEFKMWLRRIITYQFQHRDDKWGNARAVENIVTTILAEYFSRDGSGPITENCIPERMRKQVDNSTLKVDSIQALLGELNHMIGLQEVKKTIEDIIYKAIASRRLMEARGASEMNMMDLNFVFSGPPGTGKTSVARLLGRILKSAGILPSSDVLECGKQDIIRPELGGTTKRVEELFKQSNGKILFIDEAYSLMDSMDAINTFVHCMTKQEYKGKMAIILAGYPAEMKALLDRNSGMSRRFGYFLNFENYSDAELWEIFKLKVAAAHMLMDEDSCKERAIKWFSGLVRDSNFENAGCCDKLLELVMNSWGRRTALLSAPTRTEMETLVAEDFPS